MDFDSLPDDNAQAPPKGQPLNFDSLPDDSSSIQGAIGAGAESGLSALTFGGSRGLENEISKGFHIPSLSGAAQTARESAHPFASFVGGLGAALTGEGAAGAIVEAGAAASALGGASRIGSAAIKYGVEGALYGGGNEVGKMLISDPGQTAGSAAINIGLSGLIGSGIGAGLSGAGSLWAARNASKLASALDSAGEAINSTEVNLPNSAGEFAQSEPISTDVNAPNAAGLDLNPNPQNLNEVPGMTSIKPNADEIKGAFSRLGMEAPSTGTLSNSELVQNAEGNLAQRPSIAGGIQKARFADDFSKLTDAAQSTLEEKTGKSQATVGAGIKKDISNTLLENLKPIEDGYKAAEGDLAKVPIDDNMKLKAIDPIANHDFVRLDPEAASVAKRVSGQIEGIENVSDLKKVRTLISSQLNAEYGAGQGGGPKAQVLQTAKTALDGMRASALDTAAKTGAIAPDALENIKGLDAQYAGFQNTVKQLGVEGGLGKANTARSLLSRFQNLSDESFAKKVFDTGDVRNMEFFKENFPEAFEKARTYKLAEIADASIDNAQGKNGRFSLAKYLTQVRNLDPEARSTLFGSNLQKIGDIETAYKAIPGAQNTSGTDYARTFSKMFSPEGVVQNFTDLAQAAWLKALPHLSEAASLMGDDDAAKLGALQFASHAQNGTDPSSLKSSVDYIRAAIKGNNALSTGVNNFFDATKAILPSHLIPDQESRDKLQKQINHVSNPQNALKVGNAIGQYMPGHTVATSSAATNAINYLNALRPRQPVNSPMDIPPPIDKTAQAKYNRALDVAEQPLMAIHYAKSGELLPQDVVTLHTIYPAIHAAIVQKMTNAMIENKEAAQRMPYAQRVSMNLLMSGNPLDSTMSQSSAYAIMASNLPQQTTQQQGQKKPGTGVALKQINKVNQMSLTREQAREANRKA